MTNSSSAKSGALLVFTYPKADPDDETERAVAVQVATDGASLFFFPQRSAAQASLLARLGYGTA